MATEAELRSALRVTLKRAKRAERTSHVAGGLGVIGLIGTFVLPIVLQRSSVEAYIGCPIIAGLVLLPSVGVLVLAVAQYADAQALYKRADRLQRRLRAERNRK